MKIKNTALLFAAIFIIFLLLKNSEVAAKGIYNGILMCGNVIIPSLFIFTVAAIFIINCGILNPLQKNNITYFLSIYLLSALGGYPIGAKITSEAAKNNVIDKSTAKTLMRFCVNAGPSFVISFAGFSVYASRNIGVILLIANLGASFVIFCCSIPRLKGCKINLKASENIGVSEAFVLSVYTASEAILGICSYVILFSGVLSIASSQSLSAFLNKVILFFEVTNAVTINKNIYFASFMLGFGGLCIIGQILSVAKNISVKFFEIFIFRLIHGGISVCITYLLLKIFKIRLTAFSNITPVSLKINSLGFTLSAVLLLLCIVLIYSIDTKKISGKPIKDLLEI